MQISSLGRNLNILIPCDYKMDHNWMSFVCWYSISKNLPEASVGIACNRKTMKQNLFLWTRRCGVDCFFHKDTDLNGQIEFAKKNGLKEPVLVADVASLCIRDFEETKIDYSSLTGIILAEDHSDVLSDCKSLTTSLFASYRKGWGTFAYSKWIDTNGCPLISNLDFRSFDMTVNESRIRNLWNSAIYLYNNVSRG